MMDKSTSRTTIAPHVPTIEQINAIENKPGYARKQKYTKAYKARETKKN
jgi:hypothetical protein